MRHLTENIENLCLRVNRLEMNLPEVKDLSVNSPELKRPEVKALR